VDCIVKKLVIAGAALALISAVPALAADLPAATYAKTPVYVPPPVYNWTGFYIGGNRPIGSAMSSARPY
jgi:outer membrane immunogenic protein